MNFLNGIFQKKGGNGFHPSLGKIKSRTQEFVKGVFGEKGTEHNNSGFSEGLSGSNTTNKKTSGFKEFEQVKSKDGGFGAIPKKTLNTKDLIGNIEPSKLISTNRKIQKVHLAIPYKTAFFDKNGSGIEILEKGTFVNFDNESPIFSMLDEKTGKYQAYAKVQSITNHQDPTQNTLDYTDGGYIRAPWLDSVIQRKDTTRTETIHTQTTEKPKKISFSGYVGPDGKEIPEYLIKSVTINYFGTVIAPKVNSQLISINQDIANTRKSIVAEVMGKNIPVTQTSGYVQQRESIKKRDSWKDLGNAIDAIRVDGDTALENPNIAQIIKNMQSKPTWQTIIQKAAYIHMQQRKGLIPKRTYH